MSQGYGVFVADEIESITGRLTGVGADVDLTWFVVSHADGGEEVRRRSPWDATDLASAAGLTVLPPVRPGTFRWVREEAIANGMRLACRAFVPVDQPDPSSETPGALTDRTPICPGRLTVHADGTVWHCSEDRTGTCLGHDLEHFRGTMPCFLASETGFCPICGTKGE